MKQKAPLALVELSILLVVFTLAALLCIRAFLWADTLSAESRMRDRAWLMLQTAAEAVKADRGDFARTAERLGGRCGSEGWTVGYDENWQVCGDEGLYILRAERMPAEKETMGMARLTIGTQDVELAVLQVGWQEEAYAEE